MFGNNVKTQKMKTKLMLLSFMLISTLSFPNTIIRVKSGEKIQDIIDSDKNPTVIYIDFRVRPFISWKFILPAYEDVLQLDNLFTLISHK